MRTTLFLLAFASVSLAQKPQTLIVPYVNPAKGMPTTIDAKTKAVLQRSVNAYAKLKSVEVVVTGDETVRVRKQDKAMSETRQGTAWAFDSKTLTARIGTEFVKISAKQRQVPDKLLRYNIYLDPLTRCFAYGLNPVKDILVKKQRAKLRGSVILQGVRCSVVELIEGDRLLSLAVRPDGLLAGLGSTVGPVGARIRADRRFAYVSINKPLPMSSFRLK